MKLLNFADIKFRNFPNFWSRSRILAPAKIIKYNQDNPTDGHNHTERFRKEVKRNKFAGSKFCKI